jgi:hypothetical protein
MSPRSLTIPISSGSDPEPIEMDDATEAIGVEPETDEFAYPVEVCDLNAAGSCEYTLTDNFRRCIHCGRRSEL